MNPRQPVVCVLLSSFAATPASAVTVRERPTRQEGALGEWVYAPLPPSPPSPLPHTRTPSASYMLILHFPRADSGIERIQSANQSPPLAPSWLARIHLSVRHSILQPIPLLFIHKSLLLSIHCSSAISPRHSTEASYTLQQHARTRSRTEAQTHTL